jgi:ketosteroid isomerase-like protein
MRSQAAPCTNVGVDPNDYVAVLHMVSLYCHLVDRAIPAGETPDVTCLFHPEAVFTNSFQDEEFVGRDAVVEWYHTFLGKRKGHFRFTRHKIYAPCIEFDGGVAFSSCHYDADSLDFHGVIQRMAGRYDHLLENHDGAWLIRRKHCDVHYIPQSMPATPFRGWR